MSADELANALLVVSNLLQQILDGAEPSRHLLGVFAGFRPEPYRVGVGKAFPQRNVMFLYTGIPASFTALARTRPARFWRP